VLSPAESEIENQHLPEELSRLLPSTSSGKAWGGVSAARVGQVVDELTVPAIASHAIMMNIGSPFSMEERLDGRVYRTFGNKGDIAVVPAGRPIEFSARKPQEVESFVMHLDPDFVDRIAQAEGVNTEGIELVGSVGGRDPKLEQFGLSLLSELENEAVLGGLYAESLATLLAVHLLRSHSSLGRGAACTMEQGPSGALSGSALRRVKDYIEDNLAETLTLSEISGVAHMSPFHFSRVFKLATGLSPHRYVVGRRVERAKDLLTNTNLPLHEVARLSGFSDQSHLAKHTRRLLGAAPRSLRLASG
jgi:AraC family transcriptional regulator